MKNIIITICLALLFCGSTYAQLNSYKYIIVPRQFDIFQSENQHQTSTVVKYLFTQQGFNAVYDGNFPPDLYNDECLGLRASLNDDSSLFVTKVGVVLKDCYGVEIFATLEGRSKLKDYKEAYREALMEAFNSFNGVSYSYEPKETTTEPVTVSFDNDVRKLEDTAKQEEMDRETKMNKNRDPNVVQEATSEVQKYESKEPVSSEIVKNTDEKKTSPEAATPPKDEDLDILYAQPISNGYQLVDSKPSVRIKLLTTSVPDVFMAENEKGNGVVYKKDSKWVFEYYVGAEKKVEELNIKF